MREEADILILDEPTAALDAEAEHAVFQRFRALAAGRTTILISHRFPTVRMADRILVLEAGASIEDGSHAELLAAGRRYAQLFGLQAAGLRIDVDNQSVHGRIVVDPLATPVARRRTAILGVIDR